MVHISSHTVAREPHRPADVLVSAGAAGKRAEARDAVVTDEVVARHDLVHLEAFSAGVAFAHVALQQALPAQDGAVARVAEQSLVGGTAAGLTIGVILHRRGMRQPSETYPV